MIRRLISIIILFPLVFAGILYLWPDHSMTPVFIETVQANNDADDHRNNTGHTEGEAETTPAHEHDKASSGSEEGRIVIPVAVQKSSGIQIEVVTPAQISVVSVLSGEVRIHPDRQAHVVPRLKGVVTEVNTELGDNVKKGDVLIVLESRELAELKSDYLVARQQLNLADTTYAREAELWEQKISAEQDYLAARNERSQAEIAVRAAEQALQALSFDISTINRIGTDPKLPLNRYEVRAPMDGVVIEKHAVIGEALTEDENVFTIADLATVIAAVSVSPKIIDTLSTGQSATVRSVNSSLIDEGTLTYIGSLVGEDTRQAIVHIQMDNTSQRWRPGQFVEAEITEQKFEVPVAIKPSAIQTINNEPVVFIRVDEDEFEARPLKAGRQDRTWVEVLEGINPGDMYVTQNSFLLKAELGKNEAEHEH